MKLFVVFYSSHDARINKLIEHSTNLIGISDDRQCFLTQQNVSQSTLSISFHWSKDIAKKRLKNEKDNCWVCNTTKNFVCVKVYTKIRRLWKDNCFIKFKLTYNKLLRCYGNDLQDVLHKL